MDGYHLYRKDLDEEGMKRRGATFTFDSKKFKLDLEKLKSSGEGSFPSFDHALKDPIEDAIQIKKEDKIIIVEGLYLFSSAWGLLSLFDVRIFLKGSIDDVI